MNLKQKLAALMLCGMLACPCMSIYASSTPEPAAQSADQTFNATGTVYD